MTRTSYVYKPSGARLKKLERMHALLLRCQVDTSFSSVLHYCIDATYEGDYDSDPAVFERSFKRYLKHRRSGHESRSEL